LIAGLIVPSILKAYGSEGWRFSWYYLGGGVLIISCLVSAFIRSQPEEKGLSPIGSEEKDSQKSKSKEEKAKALQWGLVYRIREMWYLGFVYFMYGFSYIIYMTFFAAYLIKEMGLSQAQAGAIWAMVGGLSIFCGVIGVESLTSRGAWVCRDISPGNSLCRLSLSQNPLGSHLSVAIFDHSLSIDHRGGSSRRRGIKTGLLQDSVSSPSSGIGQA
jgi:MFS family permease